MAPNSTSTTTTGTSTAAPEALNQQQGPLLPHLQIVDRLVEFSLITSAWDYANQRYAALKSSSTLVNNTLGRAEGALQQLVFTTVTPVLNKIEQPSKKISCLNKYKTCFFSFSTPMNHISTNFSSLCGQSCSARFGSSRTKS